MEQSIASYLFRNNQCVLPGIGKLSVVTTPADTDFINTQIKPPVHKIVFTDDDKSEAIFNELSAESEHLKMMLDAKRTVLLNGIGTFTKDDTSKIYFTPFTINESLVTPVTSVRVIHQDTLHTMLVGDKETNTAVMTEYFSEAPKKKNYWWVAPIVVASVAILILIIHFSINGFNSSGNVISIKPGSADSSYHLIK